MEYEYRILRLTDKFYRNYPHDKYPEILEKRARAYNCLLLGLRSDLYVCIPFRSEMRHNNGYHFTKSLRSRKHHSELDYSKVVITDDPSYLSSEEAVVDSDEYRECARNIKRIVSEVTSYIDDYVKSREGRLALNPRELQRRYQFSTLKYFEKELGIF